MDGEDQKDGEEVQGQVNADEGARGQVSGDGDEKARGRTVTRLTARGGGR
jgi:hypothetical protein